MVLSNIPNLDFTLHRFSGNHYELGIQQGKKFKENLNQGLKIIQGLEGFQALRPKWLPNPIFFAVARKKSTKWLATFLAKHAPNQAERLRGIADGAEIDPSWIYLLVSTEIVLGVLNWELPLPGGCSNIGVKADACQGNEPIVGRNFDYNSFILPFLKLRQNSPSKHYRSFDITASPLPGTFNGINEHGVFIGTDECFTTGEREDGLSASILIQESLENCKTTSEVLSYLRETPRGTTNKWLVADATGDIKAVEYTSKRVCVVGDGDNSKKQLYAVATNHFISPELIPIQIPRNSIFGPKAPRYLQGITIHDTSFKRLDVANQIILNKLAVNQKIDVSFMQSVLRDHSTDPTVKYCALCHHDPQFITAASMVFRLKTRDVTLCYGNPCEHDYQHIKCFE